MKAMKNFIVLYPEFTRKINSKYTDYKNFHSRLMGVYLFVCLSVIAKSTETTNTIIYVVHAYILYVF